jgi:hypothetical protein
MPIIWINFPTGSSETVHEFQDDPAGLKRYVSQIVREADKAARKADVAKARLVDLYFEVGTKRACAVVKDLDDYHAVKAVTDLLGADNVTKALNADQSADAIELRKQLPRPPRRRVSRPQAAEPADPASA